MKTTLKHYKKRVEYSLKMKREKYTILISEMAPLHFRLIKPILGRDGYNTELMGYEGPDVLKKGLSTFTTISVIPAF